MKRPPPLLYIALIVPLLFLGGLYWKVVRTEPKAQSAPKRVTPHGAGRPKPVDMFIIPGLRGPTNRTIIPPPIPTDWRAYSGGTTSRLAILLTQTNSAWLGLTHGLESIGVPFRVTTDWRTASKHAVVFVYPEVSGTVLQYDALQALAQIPRRGGALLACGVLGGGLNETFGFGEAIPSKSHSEVRFAVTNLHTAEFTDPREWTFRIANPRNSQATAGSYTFIGEVSGTKRPRESNFQPLAVYEDGTAAISQRHFPGGGAAYAFGWDLGNIILIGHNNREEGIARAYVNQFEPSLDVQLRLIRSIYRHGQPGAVTLGTVPFNRSLSILLTHDVDYSKSLSNAIEFASVAKSAGIKSTFFVQTKYVRDYENDIFFHDQAIPLLKQLVGMGMEVGSHSVAHSPVFATFESGTGLETYPDYAPFVRDRKTTRDGTILGELRVSKFLLESATRTAVRSFRPGELSNPYSLPESLDAVEILHSSSVTANSSLTHFPFRVNYSRRQMTELPIVEFPVSIEDEELPRLIDRSDQAMALARRLARYGAIMVLLVHTDSVTHKLDFSSSFIDRTKSAAWYDTISGFGTWWTARSGAQIDISIEADRCVATLTSSPSAKGLTIFNPNGFRFDSTVPPDANLTIYENQVVIQSANPTHSLRFKRR